MASVAAARIVEMGNGSGSPAIIAEITAMYEPLHAVQFDKASHGVQVQKNIKYGPSDRQRFDLFSPKIACEGPTTPFHTIIFLHSGGFRNGDSSVSPSMYDNIGYYFAQRDCICALMTYRLLPEAAYPSGAQDMALALETLGNEFLPKLGGDKEDIIAIGHSAGGTHVIHSLLGHWLDEANVNLRAAVLLSTPLHYNLSKAHRRANMLEYHRTESEDEVMKLTAVELLKSQASEAFGAKDLLLLVSEYDTDEIAEGYLLFVDAYRTKYKRFPRFEVVKGHNHLSTAYAVGLEDDYLGARVIRFLSQLR